MSRHTEPSAEQARTLADALAALAHEAPMLNWWAVTTRLGRLAANADTLAARLGVTTVSKRFEFEAKVFGVLRREDYWSAIEILSTAFRDVYGLFVHVRGLTGDGARVVYLGRSQDGLNDAIEAFVIDVAGSAAGHDEKNAKALVEGALLDWGGVSNVTHAYVTKLEESEETA